MKWSRSQLLVVIVLVLALAGVGGYAYYLQTKPSSSAGGPYSSPTPSASAGQSASPAATSSPSDVSFLPCTTANLSASVATTPGGGTAGTQHQTLKLTNSGTNRCTLYGFPGVSLVDSSGTQLGAAAIRSGSAFATFTLAPGASAYSSLALPDAGNFGAGVCSSASTDVKVFPPNQTAALLAPASLQACPNWSVTALSSTAQ